MNTSDAREQRANEEIDEQLEYERQKNDMEIRKIQNHQQAYYQALVLALTTKDEALQKECESMAESFAAHITEDQAKECRNKIEFILGGTK